MAVLSIRAKPPPIILAAAADFVTGETDSGPPELSMMIASGARWCSQRPRWAHPATRRIRTPITAPDVEPASNALPLPALVGQAQTSWPSQCTCLGLREARSALLALGRSRARCPVRRGPPPTFLSYVPAISAWVVGHQTRGKRCSVSMRWPLVLTPNPRCASLDGSLRTLRSRRTSS